MCEEYYDAIVVGAGHAGVEAALALARMKKKTLLITLNPDRVAFMPCNPSIGGPGKGHIVSELAALGAQMPRTVNESYLQARYLNESKGLSSRSLRCQINKECYSKVMKRVLESEAMLDLRMGIVDELLMEELPDGKKRVSGVKTATGMVFRSKSVIITTGVYLGGRIIIGEKSRDGGPNMEIAPKKLSLSLKNAGLSISRLQTATPPRILGRSVDFSRMKKIEGADDIPLFTRNTRARKEKQVNCFYQELNARSIEVVRKGLPRSPLMLGNIVNVGPRHCPSIDRKVIKFPEKISHQVFLEPEDPDMNEIYLQGLTTAMPPEIQEELIRTVEGLEKAEILRFGYAIEYDFVYPHQLKHTMETRNIENLYLAGQICGTSGYEEAACQGFVAGVNAALKMEGRKPLILPRELSYIGVLIDDLITKPLVEPYRIQPARVERRLALAELTAYLRLSHEGRRTGLLSEEERKEVIEVKRKVGLELKQLAGTGISPTRENLEKLEKLKLGGLKKHVSWKEILRRPGATLSVLEELGYRRISQDKEVEEIVDFFVKYEGYIEREKKTAERLENFGSIRIPAWLDIKNVPGLSNEGRARLLEKKPANLLEALKIMGVTPADVYTLYWEIKAGSGKK